MLATRAVIWWLAAPFSRIAGALLDADGGATVPGTGGTEADHVVDTSTTEAEQVVATPIAKADRTIAIPTARDPQAPALPATIDMTVRITLDGTVSDGARRSITESVRSFSEKFTAKVREVESNQRAPGAEQAEYTASTVIKANEMLKQQHGDTQSGPVGIALALLVPISSGAAGILGSYLHSVWQSITFGATAMTAVITTALMVLMPKLRSK
jgi:hypothetical protein